MTDEIGPRFTDEEVRTLIELLARYCNHDLDQWDNWRLSLPWGDVHVTITNGLSPGWPADAFRQVRPLPAHLDERESDDRADTKA